MNREIKFRVMTTQGLVYFDLDDFIDPLFTMRNFIIPALQTNKADRGIGLKDKNGKEIYEGDIVKLDYFGEFFGEFLVTFKAGYFNSESLNDRGYNTMLLIDRPIEDREIIGNIYENPELLSH